MHIRKGPNKVGYLGSLQQLLFLFVILSKQLFYYVIQCVTGLNIKYGTNNFGIVYIYIK